jgi:acyl-CoA synthetase (AMP-forming)/AMP-acid ligase II
MMSDSYGYIYFCDRLGDTFRWRGENVSTIEVENIISKNLDAAEVCVYGVELPGQEGRCGMAAIVKDEINMPQLTEKIIAELPSYARPLFIRLVAEIEHTGTFKAKKTKLVQESYNLGLFPDRVYFFNAKEQAYKQLTPNVYLDIMNGNYSF